LNGKEGGIEKKEREKGGGMEEYETRKEESCLKQN